MSRHRQVGRRWWRVAASGLFAVLAAALVAGAVAVNLEHLKLEPVLSGSMRPGIQPGDLAVLRPTSADHLHVGEIIAYLPPGQTTPVMHRIASITADGIVTKGDANPVDDPWGRVKPQSASVERLVTVIPKVGFMIDVRRQLLAIVGGILLLALAVAIWSWGHKARIAETPAGDHSHPEAQAGGEVGGTVPEQPELLSTTTKER